MDELLLRRLIDAAHGKGWMQDGRQNTCLVWKEDVQMLLIEFLLMKDRLKQRDELVAASRPMELA